MLIDHKEILNPLFPGSSKGSLEKHLATGVYEINHFGSSRWPEGRKRDEDGYELFGEYGVCDNYQQILKHHPEISDPNRKFVIALTKIVKSEQPSDGGWRWHKWGEYIGELNPRYEYIYNEDNTIQFVYCYHIYEME